MLIEDMAQLIPSKLYCDWYIEAWMRISTLRECQPHVRLQQSPTVHCVPAQSRFFLFTSPSSSFPFSSTHAPYTQSCECRYDLKHSVRLHPTQKSPNPIPRCQCPCQCQPPSPCSKSIRSCLMSMKAMARIITNLSLNALPSM